MWYRFGLRMQMLRAPLAGLLAEAAAHVLSAGYGFTMLVILFVIYGMRATATATKAASTEKRVNGLVVTTGPAVDFVANGGSVGGSVTVNGDHHVTGQVNTNTLAATSAMTAGGNITSHGQVSADGNVSIGGSLTAPSGTVETAGSHYVSGAFTSQSTVTGHSNINADGTVNAGGDVNASGGQVNGNTIAASGAMSSGGNFTSHGVVHGDNGVSSGGNISASNFGGSYQGGQGAPGAYPASGSPSNAGLGTYCNQIVNVLQNAGLI